MAWKGKGSEGKERCGIAWHGMERNGKERHGK